MLMVSDAPFQYYVVLINKPVLYLNQVYLVDYSQPVHDIYIYIYIYIYYRGDYLNSYLP